MQHFRGHMVIEPFLLLIIRVGWKPFRKLSATLWPTWVFSCFRQEGTHDIMMLGLHFLDP